MPREGTLITNPYERVSKEQLEQIHQSSLDVLMDPGLFCFNKEAADIFSSNGAEVTFVSGGEHPTWSIKIPENLVSKALDSAPKTVKLGARNEDNSLIMHGDEPRVFFVTGSETNVWLDVDFQTYVKKSGSSTEAKVPEFHARRGMVEDLAKAAHVCEHLETVDAFIRTVNIQDDDITDDNKDVNKFFASVNNTTKHFMMGLTNLEQLDNVVNMAKLIVGSEEKLKENPIISFITCLVKSPLQFVNDTTQTMIELCRRELPVVVSSSPQAGTTAPVKEMGILAQINAEVLAGITLSQLVNPGAPIIYGSVPVRARLDDLSDSYGAPETSQYNVDCAQLARFYKLPCYGSSGVCDAKVPGTQSSVERLFSNILVTLSGPQYLHLTYGLFDCNSTFCLPQTVLDDAHFQMLKFFLRDPQINQDETDTVLKQIREVMNTEQKLYIRSIRPMLKSGQITQPYPFEGDRESDQALELACDKVNELLSQPVEHIDEATTKKIFEQIPGVLPRLNVYNK